MVSTIQPECVPFLPHEYPSRRADFWLTDMSAEPLAEATLADFDTLQRERLQAVFETHPRSDRSLTGLTDEQLDDALSLTVKRRRDGHDFAVCRAPIPQIDRAFGGKLWPPTRN